MLSAADKSTTEIIKPRFEFRSFGQSFESAAKRMARLSIPIPENLWERHSDEMYILSKNNDNSNAKIRDGKMDIKSLIFKDDDLEQWMPVNKFEFPISGEILKNELFAPLKITLPELSPLDYNYEELMDLLYHHQQVQVSRVHKQRFSYIVNNTICETANILINGARVETISIESTEPGDIKKTMRDLGLEFIENINYLQMIKRVTGIINKPLAN